MYTQCPECESAFRITAEVLKVAAGMVRCGSCSHAFNSLDYLSEEKPQPKKPALDLPELKPEPDEQEPVTSAPVASASIEAERPTQRPQRISAEQSAALLKTLDQLAGDDIRIEDTGVEWRVLDDDDVSEGRDDDASESDLLSDPEVTNAFFVGDIERYNAAAREQAGAAGNEVDETFEAFEAFETPVDEDLSRDLGEDAYGETRVDMDADVAEVFANSVQTDNEPYAETGVIDVGVFNPLQTHVDEILHDSETPIHELVAPSEAEAEAVPAAPKEEVLRFDDNTPLPDDFLDDEPQVAAQSIVEPTIDDSQSFDASVTLGNPDEWQQLLNDFDDLLAGENAPPAEAQADSDLEPTQSAALTEQESQPEIEPEHTTQTDASQDTVATDVSGDDWEPLPALVMDAPEPFEDNEPAETHDVSAPREDVVEAIAAVPADDATVAAPVDDDDWGAGSLEDDGLDLSQILDPDDDGLVDAGESDPERDDADLPDVLNFGNDPAAEEPRADDFDIPELSEEEQTINMLIDQDLLSVAREDKDGFTSTIVFEDGVDPLSASSITRLGDGRIEETILFSGSDGSDAAADEEALVLDDLPEASSAPDDKPRNFMWLGAAAVLVIALSAQAIHQMRDQLATNPTFMSVLAPVYETLGMPLNPDWDVSGWAIERTQGATDGTDQLLTIISELRNRTGKPMPYPIITVSLTDRSQDPVGSLVVEPKDYLVDSRASGNMVAGGVQFQARIPVDAPPGDASGYTINACYRTDGNALRCANEDFLR